VAKAQGVAVLLAIKPDMVQRQLPGILSQSHLGTAKSAGTYAGVKYYSLQITACGMKPSTSSSAFGAIVGTEGVVTPTVKDLQGEINVLQGKAKSLASTASYQHLVGVLPPVGLGYLYVNTAALVQAGSGVASSLGGSTGAAGAVPSVSGLAKGFGPFGAVLLAQANGLQVESDQLLNTAVAEQGSAVTPNKGATMLPMGTMFYLSIGNFPGVVNGALSALKASASAQDAATYNQLGAMFGSVLKVLNGEFALGVLPMSPKQASALSAGKIGALPLAALFGVSDPTAAGAVISSLLGLLGGSSTQTQSQTTLKPSPLANCGMAFTNAAGYGYATLQHWLIASTALKNVVASIQSVLGQPQNSLAASSPYQQAAAGLPKNSDATAYLNITALRTLIEGLSMGSMSKSDLAQYQQVRPLLLPMKALEAGISLQDNGKTLRTDAFLLIGR
jgi:hypothetical protein